jgi:diaminopimelate epimerase
MTIHFNKYQGTGNDFILIDNRKGNIPTLDVAKLCHPKFGIGADGLMLLQNKTDYDFEMVYYNSDGNISTMCGNGGRCIVDFAKQLGVFPGNTTTFLAVDGPHQAFWTPNKVELHMKDVTEVNRDGSDYVLNTGSPHYVAFMEDLNFDLITWAKAIRYNNTYQKEGINVNAVKIINANTIAVRTYERGVENETLSCGTGVTACAMAFALQQNRPIGPFEVTIQTPGGALFVKFEKQEHGFKTVYLCGPATEVFSGQINL